jgi:hypothetical protein
VSCIAEYVERFADNGRPIVAPNRRNDKGKPVGTWQTECCARLVQLSGRNERLGPKAKVTCRRVFGAEGRLGECIPNSKANA